MINKEVFHKSVMDMVHNPKSIKVQKTYYGQIYELSKILSLKYHASDLEESIANLIEYSVKKRLFTRIKPDQNAFSYYWKSLSRHLGVLNKLAARNSVFTSANMNGNISTNTENENDMIDRLDFTLEEFEPESSRIEEFFDEVETVVAVKTKRGRPKLRKEGEFAPHWEYLFSFLRHKKTMTINDLINLLPANKRKGFKNPQKSVEYYLRAIARREGLQLTISNNGTDLIYMLVGE